MKYKFIINLNTDNGIRFKDLGKYKDLFHGLIGSFDYALPTSYQDAVQITRDFIHAGADRVIAVGGDGTVNSVANGFFENGRIINPDAALVVTRGGSGWDYYRSITKGHSVAHWTDIVARHETRMVDIGTVSFEDPAFESRYFVNMASVGMVADVVKVKEHIARMIPGKARYLMATLYCLFNSGPRELEISTGGQRFTVDALAVTISKGNFAGGGMKFGLNVSLDDGFFEATVIKKSSAPSMALKLAKIFSGNYANEPEIMKLKTASISIRSKSPVASEFDGEVHGATGLTIGLLPKTLNVCFPLEYSPRAGS